LCFNYVSLKLSKISTIWHVQAGSFARRFLQASIWTTDHELLVLPPVEVRLSPMTQPLAGPSMILAPIQPSGSMYLVPMMVIFILCVCWGGDHSTFLLHLTCVRCNPNRMPVLLFKALTTFHLFFLWVSAFLCKSWRQVVVEWKQKWLLAISSTRL
jgi:hypothetical protein